MGINLIMMASELQSLLDALLTNMRTNASMYFITLTVILIASQLARVQAQRSIFSIGSKVTDPKVGAKKKTSGIFASAADVDGGKNEDSESGDEDDVIYADDEDSRTARSEVFQSCEVGFENIQIVLQGKNKKKPDRHILDGSLKGIAKPGRMLAIMGPSGSGKSSLIHAIAGRIDGNKKITVSGQRYVNGAELAGDSPLPCAFIEQEVNFFPHMTVKETLDFRVELKLGSSLGKSARDAVVLDLLEMLGLTKSADTIVGNTKVRGLSGGERKRLSIACELISSPPVLILDEPTSGLDSYQAGQVTDFLRKLADEQGKTIISVIHQPSQSVFAKFDDLLLVSEGRLMYYGETSKIRQYLSGLGYNCSKDTGTAEHVLDCISRTNGGTEEEKESDARLQHLSKSAITATFPINVGNKVVVATKHHHHKYRMLKFGAKKKGPAANIFKQFRLLLSRAFNETLRGKTSIVIKVVQQVTLGAIYGGIYKVGNDQASINDRFGLLSLIAIGGMNMAVAGTIRSFTKEKSIVKSELAGGMYRTLPYFLAKAISEIPLAGVFNAIFGLIIYPSAGLQKGKFRDFLALTTLHTMACEAAGLFIGAVAPNSDVALSLFPAIVVLNIIFDGRNISEENTPKLLKWIPKLSLIRWGFEGLSVNEFNGLTFSTDGPLRGPVVRTGNEALARFGMDTTKLSDVIGAQSKIIGACWFLSFLGLSFFSDKFESMAAP